MKLLVLTKDYPRPDGTHERMYVHVRDVYYKKSGAEVTVLNFACGYDYEIDGIRTISLKTFEKEKNEYDIVISHASNIRNHYIFLKKHEKEFNRIIFFFHGHEILRMNESYPAPYPYMKQGMVKKIIRGLYDEFKLRLWKKYYYKLRDKAEYVFVSNWIYNQFRKNIGLDKNVLSCRIINNSISAVFEDNHYDDKCQKEYNFITIRSNLDGSNYSIDIVVRMARENPGQKFLLIGRGRFFDYNKKPDNIEWINTTMNHEEMLHYIDISECGLIPTRQDTQGVMTCELAVYGIPVITSDIEVCHEFFGEMPNVALIDNDAAGVDIIKISERLRKGLPYGKDKRYHAENTIRKEILLFEEG